MTFLNEKDLSLLSYHQIDNQIIVEYPNSTTATSIGSGLYQPAIGISPILAAVFANRNLQRSLISLGDICNNDQEIKLTEMALEISKGKKSYFVQQSFRQINFGPFLVVNLLRDHHHLQLKRHI